MQKLLNSANREWSNYFILSETLFYIVGVISLLGVLKQSAIVGIYLIAPIYILFIYLVINAIALKKIYINSMLLLYASIALAVSLSKVEFKNYNYETLFYVTPFYFALSFILPTSKIYFEKFSKGARLSIKINIIYSFLVAISWYIFEFDLAANLLEDTLQIDSSGHTFTNSYNYLGLTILRVCGFSWDPMHMGLIGVLGYILFKQSHQWSWMLCSLIGLVLSGSRAGLFALIVVVIYELYKSKISFNKRISITFFLSVLIVFTVWVSISRDMEALGNIRRIAYFIITPIAMLNGDTIDFFVGGSPYSTGNTLINSLGSVGYNNILIESLLYSLPSNAWNIETDIISILVGRGLIGLLIWLFLNQYVIKKTSGSKRLIFIGLFSLSLNYNYEFSMYYQFLLLLFSYKIVLKF